MTTHQGTLLTFYRDALMHALITGRHELAGKVLQCARRAGMLTPEDKEELENDFRRMKQ